MGTTIQAARCRSGERYLSPRGDELICQGPTTDEENGECMAFRDAGGAQYVFPATMELGVADGDGAADAPRSPLEVMVGANRKLIEARIGELDDDQVMELGMRDGRMFVADLVTAEMEKRGHSMGDAAKPSTPAPDDDCDGDGSATTTATAPNSDADTDAPDPRKEPHAFSGPTAMCDFCGLGRAHERHRRQKATTATMPEKPNLCRYTVGPLGAICGLRDTTAVEDGNHAGSYFCAEHKAMVLQSQAEPERPSFPERTEEPPTEGTDATAPDQDCDDSEDPTPTAPECRRCVECEGEEHHWIEDFEFATEEPEHPAAKAGVAAWQNCKHCDAWLDGDGCKHDWHYYDAPGVMACKECGIHHPSEMTTTATDHPTLMAQLMQLETASERVEFIKDSDNIAELRDLETDPPEAFTAAMQTTVIREMDRQIKSLQKIVDANEKDRRRLVDTKHVKARTGVVRLCRRLLGDPEPSPPGGDDGSEEDVTKPDENKQPETPMSPERRLAARLMPGIEIAFITVGGDVPTPEKRFRARVVEDGPSESWTGPIGYGRNQTQAIIALHEVLKADGDPEIVTNIDERELDPKPSHEEDESSGSEPGDEDLAEGLDPKPTLPWRASGADLRNLVLAAGMTGEECDEAIRAALQEKNRRVLNPPGPIAGGVLDERTTHTTQWRAVKDSDPLEGLANLVRGLGDLKAQGIHVDIRISTRDGG